MDAILIRDGGEIQTRNGIEMKKNRLKKTELNGSADLLADAIRNSQKEVADETVKRVAELLENSNKEILRDILKANKEEAAKNLRDILKANKEEAAKNKEEVAKNFDRMGRELRKELKEDLHKYMGLYTQKHESRITKLEKRLAEK